MEGLQFDSSMKSLTLEKLETLRPSQRRISWPQYPYKGLNFFSYSDAPLFSQRDGDARACASIVGSAANKLLLIHGRSGAGKSSFLRAGLIPRLEDVGFVMLKIAGGTTRC
jgi:hypothetical protein